MPSEHAGMEPGILINYDIHPPLKHNYEDVEVQ